MRNIFLQKPFTKCFEETVPRPFSKKSKLSLSLHWQSKALCSLLSFYANLKAIGIYWNCAADHLLLPHIKQKKAWNWSYYRIFCMISTEKYFFCYIVLTDQGCLVVLSGWLYFPRYWSIYRMLSNSVTLSNSTASLIILPDFFAFKTGLT